MNDQQLNEQPTPSPSADEGTSVSPGVLNVPTYDFNDEQISWKSIDDEDDDDVDDQSNDDEHNDDGDRQSNDDEDDDGDSQGDDDQHDNDEQTKSDNDGDDFVHPKLSTHDDKERHDDDDYGEVTQGGNDEDEKMDEVEEVNELYRDVNINLEGRDNEMTDIPQTNLQGSQVTKDAHVILTTVTPKAQQQSSSISSGFISNMLNLNLDTGIDSILNLNTESTSLVDFPITTNVKIHPSSLTTLPHPPIPLIQPRYQTAEPIPIMVLSPSLQNLLTFSSLFKFEDRAKDLEDDFSEFKQTNRFAEAVSSILGIVNSYLSNKMNEAVKTDV
uniref:Uncharacterized protein n=1 Tax=Tanacetum cinerariifolium TaxID=118510 RepID=A0A6L2MH44_TANCI|nr:hypothetical protein [Tanacetum cinerariifolium]